MELEIMASNSSVCLSASQCINFERKQFSSKICTDFKSIFFEFLKKPQHSLL
ncbi:Cyclic nucleotide-gated ion channel 1 isoform 1 [Zea mays]|uniref:Cyclic nucleotide-gated ion channel 1 isoform 1 n=1 Tax=Zea mays TaxID=4577 RepID=A0A1D6QPA8_MAIZE|nr:Cyclic nucleotide-gated ion channel 1 isoform 1 [Zea mays]